MMDCGYPIFTRGRTAFHEAIAWFSRARGEGRTLATHMGLGLDPVYTVHALIRGVVRIPWLTYRTACDETGIEWLVMRPRAPYSVEEESVIQECCDEMTGHDGTGHRWRYSVTELGFQAADNLLNRALPESRRARLPGRVWMGDHHELVWFRRAGDLIAKRVICSRTANRALIKVGRLPIEYRHASPDDTLDLMMSNGLWEPAACSSGWAALAVRHGGPQWECGDLPA